MSDEGVAENASVRVSVAEEAIGAADLMDFVADPAAGCTVLFTGTVRDHSPGRDGVFKLEYEAYSDVVEGKIREIVAEAMERWSVCKIAAVHRTGTLGIGESSVMVAVSAAHRAGAFPAARYVIDELKSRVPIWKKEHWSGGAEWVEEGD
ncbi:MAG: molybdenum cofactor biosynthesis protein MoaE [Acidimicrobiia bacterium]|nr:MAG: molybdenum cofactor biosynthesis protein MoaE [Acidimicrobiia bacterium]